tara:strand:- start:309 stop:1139 length:831 start_codon:yes stop_codon:yes gene_type:complete
MKVLLYGNCQTGVIPKIIQHPDINFKRVVCWSTNLTKKEFDKEIKFADIIITQPIRENYRDKEYLSTSYIAKNANQNAEIILFPSLYSGTVYYFDAISNESVNQATTTAFTHETLVNYYMEGGTDVGYFNTNFVSNKNLLTNKQLESNAQTVIGELKLREDEAIKQYGLPFIPMSHFIEDNWKKNLLFYTQNHGTSHLYQYLAQKICEKIGINGDSIDLKKDPGRGHTRMIVYSCLENIVKFDTSKCLPPKLILADNSVVDTTNDYIDSIFAMLKS